MSQEEIIQELKNQMEEDYKKMLDQFWALDMETQEYGEIRGIFALLKEKEYEPNR